MLVICLLLPVFVSAATSETDIQAYYDYRNWQYTVASESFTLSYRERKTILGPRGDKFNTVVVDENSFEKVKLVSLRVVDADGNELYSKDKDDFTKQCGFGAVSLYEDVCYYYFEAYSANYPYSIEFEYEVTCSSLFFLKGNVIQSRLPVHNAELLIATRSEVGFSYQCRGTQVTPASQPSDDGGRVFRWTYANIPGYDPVAYLPSAYDEPVAVLLRPDIVEIGDRQLSPRSWGNIGSWYRDLAEDTYVCDPMYAIDREGVSLREQARAIYDSLTRDVRYVSISIGVGGWQPHAADLTASRKFGDCKDMTTLLISQLGHIGITAYPSLILTRDEGVTDSTFPNVMFNHVITLAIIAGDSVWMDPTCEHCRFGELPSADENTLTLLVAEDGGKLVKTPASEAENNVMVRKTSFTIMPDMSYTVEANYTFQGNLELWYKSAFSGLDGEETGKLVKRICPGAGEQFAIDSYRASMTEDKYMPSAITFSGHSKRPLDYLGGKIYIPALPYPGLSDLEQTDIEGRQAPIDLSYPAATIDSVFVYWNFALEVDSIDLPESIVREYAFGAVAFDCDADGDSVVVVLRKERSRYDVLPDMFSEFEDYRNFLKQIYKQYVKLYAK